MDESWEDVDWAELMAEPPGGVNHGRRKTVTGGWQPLEAVDYTWDGEEKKPVPVGDDLPTSRRHVGKRRHGTTYTYVKIGCRCQVCKDGWARYIRERRLNGGK